MRRRELPSPSAGASKARHRAIDRLRSPAASSTLPSMPSPLQRALPALALLCSCAAVRPAPTDVASMLARAQDDLAAGQYDEAARRFEAVLERDPRSFAALRGRIETARRRGDLPRVASEAAAAAKSRPTDGVAFYSLGLARSAQGDPGAARAALTRAVELLPGDADAAYRLGLVLLEGQELAAARASLARSVELEPSAVRHRIALAACLARMGDRVSAVRALREVPRLHPTAEEASLAVKAARDIVDPFRDVPADARNDIENAVGYLSGDAPGLALETLEGILERFPDLAIAHALVALAAQRVDEQARAVAELKRAAELAPYLPQPHAWLGEQYESTDRPQLAAQEYAAAVELAPLDTDALRRLGVVRLERLGQPAAALEPLRDAALLDPADPSLQILVARAELAAGEAPGGLARLDRLVAGHPEEVEVLVGVATVLLDRSVSLDSAERPKLTRRVVALCEKALELRPQSTSAARLLAQARAAPGSTRN
jgi:tetratricopeptide (TPR) repeat protein